MFLHFQNEKNEELRMNLFSVFWHEQGRHKQASNATVTISALLNFDLPRYMINQMVWGLEMVLQRLTLSLHAEDHSYNR